MSRQGSWERKIWEDLSSIRDEETGALKVVDTTDTSKPFLSLRDKQLLLQTELLALLLSEQKKTNFLLERISGVEIDAEVFLDGYH